MARLNGLDRRNPTLSAQAVRVVAGQFIETDSSGQLGTWTFDAFIPAYAVVLDIVVVNEVVWGATTAVLDIGDYAVDSDTGGIDTGTALDANGFMADLSLVSGGDIAAGGAVSFNHIVDASEGAYLPADLAVQTVFGNGLIHTSDRFIRASLTTGTAAGTQAGKTFVYVIYAVPELDVPTFTAA